MIMIQNRQDLTDFALRQLGAPVINIEVDASQIEDCIDIAMQYYIEHHFDGVERTFLVYKIQGTQVVVDNASPFIVGQTIASLDGKTTSLISSINGNTLIINKQVGYNKFSVGQQITTSGNNNPLATIQSITLGDPDNGYVAIDDTIMGVMRLLNITSILGSSDYMFNVQYQIMMSEIQNLTSQGMAYFYGVQQYLGELDFVMKKEKDFRFNRRTNQLYIDVDWMMDIRVGDIIAVECYKMIDDSTYPKVLNDIWLKNYVIAQIKKVWGASLKKYDNMQLPGGVTFKGQKIYDEAVNEIMKLEDEAINSSAPLNFFIG